MKLLVLITVGCLCLVGSAYADHLSVSIGVTCDPTSERALVRLGYADDEDEPKFAEIGKSLDGGLSLLPVNDFSDLPTKFIATCTLPSGGVVKAVLKRSQECPRNWCEYRFSIWVNKANLIQDETVGNLDTYLAFGVIVNRNAYKQCNYHLTPDKNGYFDVYSLTTAGSPKKESSIPVVCDPVDTKYGQNSKLLSNGLTNTENLSDKYIDDTFAKDFVNQAFMIGKSGAESITKYYSTWHKKPTDFKQAGFVVGVPRAVRSISLEQESNIIHVELRTASHQAIEFTPIFDDNNYQVSWQCRGQGIPARYLSEQCSEPEMKSTASFDCSKSSTDIETMICGNVELSALDAELNNLYHHVSETSLDKKFLKQEQRRWLKDARNVCHDINCLKAAYMNRIAVLSRSD